MKRTCFAVVTSLSILLPAVALANKDLGVKEPEKTAAFATWTPVQQWMPNGRSDPRSEYGYGSLAGALLLADELADNFSELGRASLLEVCLAHADKDMKSTLAWAMCGPDAKALDLKKLESELTAGGVSAEATASVVKEAKETLDKAQAIGAVVEAAAKDDPGVQSLLKLTDTAKAEWTAYLGKHKADFDRYLALKDGVRSNKSNNKAFEGCWEATQPAFAKLVKATAPKIPWDVGNDALPGYMKYLTDTTESYITSVAFAACAWSVHESGEAMYVAAANQSFGGHLHAGWRTIALAKALDPALKLKFADRSLNLGSWTFQWKYGVKMTGVNDITAIMTPKNGVMGKLTVKDDVTVIGFKGDKVEECLQWKETNKVAQVTGGSVSYEKVCVKRGMVDNQTGEVEVSSKLTGGLKVGDEVTVVYKIPVVSWKGKKLTALLGVSLR